MANHKYMTSPPNLTGMPPGVPYIIGNEAAERFSYYGMRRKTGWNHRVETLLQQNANHLSFAFSREKIPAER